VKIALIRTGLVAPVGSVNNEPSPPLGLAYLSSYLKKCGHTTCVIDAMAKGMDNIVEHEQGYQTTGILADEIIKLIPTDVDVIGFSIMFTHEWIYVRDVIRDIKLSFPKVTIIAGGEHISALPKFSMEDCPSIDFCVVGEGEETIGKLLEALPNRNLIKEVNGIAYFDNNSNYIVTEPGKRIKEVGQLPYPDWESVPIDIYFENNISHGAGFGRNIPIMASRGCPYKCTFCSNVLMWTTRYYIRTVDDVMNEVTRYVEKYKVDSIQFADLTAILKGSWIIEFSKKIKAKYPNLVWTLPSGTRSEALNRETLEPMAAAGLKYLVYAPESGSEKTLKEIKKRISLEKMTSSIKTAIDLNVPTRCNFIIGFPSENRLDIYKTIKQALYYSFIGVDETPLFPYQPYPGTEIFDQLNKDMNMKLDDNYFLALISLSTGNLGVPLKSYNPKISRYELYVYRIFALIATYSISYLAHPSKIMRLIRNINTDVNATVFEGRLKILIRRFRLLKPLFR